VAESLRIRPRGVAHMTSLSVRKVQELAQRGELPSAALEISGWTFDERHIQLWIGGQETTWADVARAEKDQERARATTVAASILSEDAIAAAAKPWPTAERCGVYFLLVGGRVMYVGQSRHMIRRIAMHAAARRFDAWHCVPCSRRRLDALERVYINAFLPPWNADHITAAARRAKVMAP
jgi:hypothetical protein